MILSIIAKTPMSSLTIDYIEGVLPSGDTVSLNWEESLVRPIVNNEYIALYKGVCFGEESGSGHCSELKDFQITDVGIYSEANESPQIALTYMSFCDEADNVRTDLTFSGPLFVQGDFSYCVEGIDKDDFERKDVAVQLLRTNI